MGSTKSFKLFWPHSVCFITHWCSRRLDVDDLADGGRSEETFKSLKRRAKDLAAIRFHSTVMKVPGRPREARATRALSSATIERNEFNLNYN